MSFKDAFTKDGAGGNPLNYDDSAFAYFATTCLTCVLVPWSYAYFESRLHVFSQCFASFTRALRLIIDHLPIPARRVKVGEQKESTVECACSLCQSKKRQLLAEKPLWQRFFGSPADYLQLIGIVLLAAFVGYIASHYLTTMPNVASFNPWTILNITEDTSERDIRRAFRTMSLKYHPDKNPNDAAAAAQFLLISKAYQTLTNEAARRNFEKYGNPDGSTGMMKVGIGLPTFMIREDFQVFILAVFFVTLLVIVPGCFLLYYNHINQYSPNGLKKDTVHILGGTMSPKISAHRVIALIAASSEIRDLKIAATPSDLELLSRMCQGREMDKVGMMSPQMLKACLLIYVHLARMSHTLPIKMQQETRQILRQAIRVSRAMLDIAFINNWIPTIQIVLAVRKCLLQSVEIGSMPLTQIPHVLVQEDPAAEGEDKLKIPAQRLTRSKQLLETVQKYKPTDFHDLVKIALECRVEALKGMTDAEIRDIECVYKTLPKIKLMGQVFVDDEEEICAGDVATCRLTFTREHLAPGQKQGFVHSPFYPDMRMEEWFVFISDATTNELQGYKTFTDNSREVVVDIQFPVLKLGEWKMTAVVLSESYFGVDKSVDFTFRAIHQDESSRKEYVHPADVALDNQTTFVQQILGTAALDGDDEISDEDEGEMVDEREQAVASDEKEGVEMKKLASDEVPAKIAAVS